MMFLMAVRLGLGRAMPVAPASRVGPSYLETGSRRAGLGLMRFGTARWPDALRYFRHQIRCVTVRCWSRSTHLIGHTRLGS